jgi:hypothetical protein
MLSEAIIDVNRLKRRTKAENRSEKLLESGGKLYDTTHPSY